MRSLAKELTCRGYPVTFITGSVNRKKIETIPGVDFVPFRGKADFHPDRLKDEYPDRPEDGMTALYDMEHIFFGHIHEQFQVLQEVIRDVEAQGRQAIVLQDAGVYIVLAVKLDDADVEQALLEVHRCSSIVPSLAAYQS